ncbi:MAG: prephenate dehydratase [Deltaproteobacteria bacterium]|nr:prephenate dehydratase [Deltaproteobacteria bacterium]
MSEKLTKLRSKIDQLDAELIRLLSQRGQCVVQIGEIKKKLKSQFYVPEREEKIFQRLRALNPGPYKNEAIETIFREILSASLALESPLKIAYFGPEATFTHMASIKRFGLSAQFFPQSTIQKVFQEVAQKKFDFGVVPIENSTAGVVSSTLDLFVEYPLKIAGEITLPIVHNLLSTASHLKSIQKVYSHVHAFPQCRLWLESHLPGVKCVDVESTARAAELAKKEKNTAAIASEYAATRYGLKILAKHIEDHPNNFTRFVVIGHNPCGVTGNDKTSIMFSTKDEVGVLYKLLSPLAQAKINLTKIESRPLKGRAWEYIFFVDLDGHAQDLKVSKALAKMNQKCAFLKVLGSYPKGK